MRDYPEYRINWGGGGSNLCPTQVVALEAVKVRSSGRFLFLKRIRVDHHRHGLVGIEVGLTVQARQPQQGLLRLVEFPLPDKPPRRFRGEIDADDERYWPHPL